MVLLSHNIVLCNHRTTFFESRSLTSHAQAGPVLAKPTTFIPETGGSSLEVLQQTHQERSLPNSRDLRCRV